MAYSSSVNMKIVCVARHRSKRNKGLTYRANRDKFLPPTPTIPQQRRMARRRRNKMSSPGGQVETEFVNSKLTNKYHEEYKSFYLKKSVWEAIKLTHGWHDRGGISRFAECLGITRQAAARIVSGHDGCSAFMMRRIKRFMNINGECWCHLFEESRCDSLDKNHPMQDPNEAKYRGEVPYSKHSSLAEMRSQDYRVETR